MDLLTVGEAFHDLIFAGLERLPRPGEELRVAEYSATIGGGALITACAAARLGLRVSTLTGVNAAIHAELRREHIKLVNVQQPGERGAVSVALSMPRERSFVTFEGINTRLQPRLLTSLRHRPPGARHVHFALSPTRCRQWLGVLRRLNASGVTTSWDFGWNERLLQDPDFDALVGAVDWLFLNVQEARLYRRSSAAATCWRARRGGTVVKRGKNGAVVYSDGGRVRADGVPARVVDTTGAGDAFNGGFLSALLRGAGISDALSVATYVGARATEALGGIAGLPHVADLPRTRRSHLGAA